MPTQKLSWFHTSILLCLSACLILPALNVRANNLELHNVYAQIKPVLEKNAYGIPVYINSRDENDTMTGVIYGVIHHPFDVLSQTLRTPANWCDIAPQHLNIKACTYQPIKDYCQLTFYSGRKFYEKADDVYQLAYQFDINEQDKDFIHISLSSEEGPVGTSHYRLNVKAIPLGKSSSFIYFSYSYQYNFITSMGMGIYLATLGSGKVGFSITGKDKKGNSIYVDGVRGIIERNSVRYYLAIQSYLDTLHIKPKDRFTARIDKWFDLTEQHHLQLHEMDKKEYLEHKQLERKDQQRLQQSASQNSISENSCTSEEPLIKPLKRH